MTLSIETFSAGIALLGAFLSIFGEFFRHKLNDFYYTKIKNSRISIHYYNKNRHANDKLTRLTPELEITNNTYQSVSVYVIKIGNQDSQQKNWEVYDSHGQSRHFPFVLKPKETYLFKQMNISTNTVMNTSEIFYGFNIKENPNLRLEISFIETSESYPITDMNTNQFLTC